MKKTLLFLLIATVASCRGVGEAENSAKSFADRRFEGHKGVECMDRDTDGDGYVSCTVFMPNDAIAIECATENLRAGCSSSGCRMAMGKSKSR